MMKHLDSHLLLIVGGGDRFSALKELANAEALNERVRFYPKLPFNELRQLTMNSDLGLSLDKGTNLNYYYSLPNKIFDYIHSLTPAFVSAMPEVARIVKTYSVGRITNSHEPEELAKQINEMLIDERSMLSYRNNCVVARRALNWEKESEVLLSVYREL
jgi:glycosyltransferase involved in cell wall biosynthesis